MNQSPSADSVKPLQAYVVTINKPGFDSAFFYVAASNKDKAKSFTYRDLAAIIPGLDFTCFLSRRAPEYDSLALQYSHPVKLGGEDRELNTKWGCCAEIQPTLPLS